MIANIYSAKVKKLQCQKTQQVIFLCVDLGNTNALFLISHGTWFLLPRL